jgi:hypothetical protein
LHIKTKKCISNRLTPRRNFDPVEGSLYETGCFTFRIFLVILDPEDEEVTLTPSPSAPPAKLAMASSCSNSALMDCGDKGANADL